jgi:hypothetical protein
MSKARFCASSRGEYSVSRSTNEKQNVQPDRNTDCHHNLVTCVSAVVFWYDRKAAGSYRNLGVASFLEKFSTLSGGHYGASMIHKFRGR